MSHFLKELFSSGARVGILRLLLLDSHKRYYQRQIARILDLPIRSIQQEIPRLEKLQIVNSEQDGNRRYLQANRRCPIFPELQAIFLKSSGVAEALRSYLEKNGQGIRSAFIFGSYAKGDEETWSDIDLMVIGDIEEKVLGSLIYDAKEDLRRELNDLHYTPQEFRTKARAKDPFITDVLRGKKVFIIGDEDELNRIVG